MIQKIISTSAARISELFASYGRGSYEPSFRERGILADGLNLELRKFALDCSSETGEAAPVYSALDVFKPEVSNELSQKKEELEIDPRDVKINVWKGNVSVEHVSAGVTVVISKGRSSHSKRAACLRLISHYLKDSQ